MPDKQHIISENFKRLAVFQAPYVPNTGEGSLLTREKIELSDFDRSLYLPINMINDCEFLGRLLDCGNLHDLAKIDGKTYNESFVLFDRYRFEYDMEYWGYSNIIIQDKESLQDIKFKLRLAQQILLIELEKMRLAGVPIRVVILKARQWGGSTLIQMYMFWIQQIHKINWHLAVCAQDDGAAKNIAEMYQRAAKLYPEVVDTITYKPYARSSKNIINIERGGIIGVGSINNPEQFRSYNYPQVHISEAGSWEDTPKRTTAQLVQSLRSTVPKVPYSFIAIESTAKGVGSFLHEEWLAAENETSAYKAVFIPWHMIDIYVSPIEDYSSFIDTFNDYDHFLWEQGATLEGINWYNLHKSGENYDDWQMNNEYPTTPEEAFISSGQRYFAPVLITDARKNILKPSFIGTIHPVNARNKEDIKLSHFVKAVKGNLQIWKMPRPIMQIKGKSYHVVNRYCVFGDIGGVNPKADFSDLCVLDRFAMLNGGWPEVAADWHGHIDQDLFAWIAAQLGWLYDNALLAIETNSLRKEKTDGDHFFTILDNIKDHYSNLFIRNEVDRIDKDWIPKYGFHTGRGSKDMVLSALRSGYRDHHFIERQKTALDESDWFERKKDGTLGAIEGKKDDRVITRAGAYWMAITYMPPVKLVPFVTIKERKEKRYKRGSVVSEATI